MNTIICEGANSFCYIVLGLLVFWEQRRVADGPHTDLRGPKGHTVRVSLGTCLAMTYILIGGLRILSLVVG